MCFHSLTEQKIIHLAGIISKTNTHLGGIASVLGVCFLMLSKVISRVTF